MEADKITLLPDKELVALGARLRASYLLQQATYTLELALSEGEPLAKLMAAGLLSKVSSLRAKVALAFEDKTDKAAEAKLATQAEGLAARSLKEWGRGAAARAKSAIRAGVLIPDALTRAPDARSVPDLTVQAQGMLSLLGQHAALMDQVGAPTQPIIDQGRALLSALTNADGNQELSRASALPVAVASFYARKAELYLGLKMINDAGHELYSADPQSSSRFNLSILYRRHGTGQAAPGPTPPAPPAPVPPA